jgi:hypothetical protein
MEFITIHLIQNTKWLWLVNNFITIMNSNKVLCGSFVVHPSYVVGILNSVEKIHYFALHSEELNYAHYVKNALSAKSAL